MPDFPIIDTHIHLWDPQRLRYAWLDDIPLLDRPFTLQDYRQACGDEQAERIVFVECGCAPDMSLREVEFAADAAKDTCLAAIVAQASLEWGDSVEPDLARLSETELVKGVRRLLQDEPDPEFCLHHDFVRGVKLLERFGLHFEICVRHLQLAGVVALVRRCPNVRFILDHIGKPDIRSGLLVPWREEITALAEMPNVWCKLSGMATEADYTRWQPEDLRPYVDHVIERFGFDRVMYGSDWPVATLATTVPRWVTTLDRLTAGCSPHERSGLFRDNALAFYRLG